jgi:hypothetical protein
MPLNQPGSHLTVVHTERVMNSYLLLESDLGSGPIKLLA